MSLIYFLVRSSWGIVALSTVASLISGLSSAGLIALINHILHTSNSSSAFFVESFIGLCLMVFVASIGSHVLVAHLAQRSIFQLRMHLSRQILGAPLVQLKALGSARLLAILTEDVDVIADAVEWIPHLGINSAMVVGCLIYLGWLSWPTFLAVLGFMVLGAIGFQIPNSKAWRSFWVVREQNDAVYSHFRALIEGIKELKLHRQRREAFLSKALQPTALSLQRHFVAAMTTYALAISVGNLLIYAMIGLLIFVLPALQEVSIQAVASYVLTVLFMMTPLENILNALPNLGRGGVALRKVEALGITLTTHATEPDVVVPTSPKTSWERLGLVNVTHSYHREGEEGGFSLGPIDLTFQPGELVFLIGGNGGGKTTLALLLTGLCVPEGGEIRLNGHPVTDANREHYREHFSVVFSDFYLFESLLGLDSSKLDTQARDYLIQLQLNHKVRVEQGVFSTLDLSQGQRKRLALLTAYLEDRPFYVFDEWAADQDPLFKKIFYTQLLPELKARGKTVLVITHDDAYFCVADRCIKLEDGKLRHEWPRNAKSHARA